MSEPAAARLPVPPVLEPDDAREQLHLAQLAGNMGIWEWDPSTGEVIWSGELEALYGYLPGTFPRSFEAFLDAVHPADREAVLASVGRLLGEGTHEIEHRVLLPDGRLRWFQGRGRMFADARGARAIGIGIDITARKRNEQRQELLSTLTLALSESLDVAITLEHLTRVVVPSFADACTFVLEAHGDEHRRFARYFHDPELQSRWESVLAAFPGNPAVGEEIRLVLNGGSPVFWPDVTSVLTGFATSPEHAAAIRGIGLDSMLMVPLRARNHTFGVAILVTAGSGRSYDEEDLRTAEELSARAALAIDNALLHASVENRNRDLEEALTAKDEFLAMVSHELRTPVTVISAAAQVLRSRLDQLDHDALHEVAGDLGEQSDRLNQMIENLLSLARQEIARDVGDEPVLVYHLAERMAARFRRSHPGRAIQVTEEGNAVPVAVDPSYLELILTNLLSNALKYSPPGSPLEIAITRDDAEVAVAVRDRGPGVPEAEIPLIFDRFYRSQRTAKGASGAGMGLAVVKRLTEAMKGRVWAQNLARGGFEVGFSLPRYTAEGEEHDAE